MVLRLLLLLGISLTAAAVGAADPRVCIIGAGPAGLQLAYLLQRMDVPYTIFERNDVPGSFFQVYPRHRKLVSLNKLGTGSTDYEFNLRHDWNSLITHEDDPRGTLLFRDFSTKQFPPADAYLEYLHTFMTKYNISVQFNTEVTRVQRATSAHAQPQHQRENAASDDDQFDRFRKDHYAHHDDGVEDDGLPGTTTTSSSSAKRERFIVTTRARVVDSDTGQSRQVLRKEKCLPLVVATGTPIPAYPRTAPGMTANTEGYESFNASETSVLEKYRNKRVLILGSGNSAFEVANSIAGVANVVDMCSRNPPRFSWQTHYAGDVRSVNAEFLDAYQLKSQHYISTCIISASSAFGRHKDGSIEADIPYTRTDPVKDAQYAMHDLFPGRSDQRTYTARAATYDHVIRCLGFQMDPRPFKSKEVTPALDSRRKYPLLTPEWESISVSDMFFAGTLQAGRDAKRSSVFAVHGFRYAVEGLSRVIGERYFNVPWPQRILPHRASALAAAMIERMQFSSAMYQLYSAMCEVFWFSSDAAQCSASDTRENKGHSDHLAASERQDACWKQIHHIPCDMVFSDEAYLHRNFFVLTLEYHPEFGKTKEKFDVFGADHVNPSLHPDEGYKSNFLHPVVRYFSGFRHDLSEHVHFDQVDPRLRSSADSATDWQKNNIIQAQAVAIHHVMESVFIDFAHTEAHVEPLLRFLAGVFAVRPELQRRPQDSPLFAVQRDFVSMFKRPSMHAQGWLGRNLNMQPEELVEVMQDVSRHDPYAENENGRTSRFTDEFNDEKAWGFHEVLAGTHGVQIEGAASHGSGGAASPSSMPGHTGGSGIYGHGSSARHGESQSTTGPPMISPEHFEAFANVLQEQLEQPHMHLPELDDVQERLGGLNATFDGLAARIAAQKKRLAEEDARREREAATVKDGSVVDTGVSMASPVRPSEGSETNDEESAEVDAIIEDANELMDAIGKITAMFDDFTKGGADDGFGGGQRDPLADPDFQAKVGDQVKRAENASQRAARANKKEGEKKKKGKKKKKTTKKGGKK